jgi:DNA-directed RNA polymerase specialized sigma24 family protein
LKQGCVLSPLLFSIVIDDILKKCKEKYKNLAVGKWKMKNVILQELPFADDMVLVAETEEILQQNLEIYQKELREVIMEVNIEKQNYDNTRKKGKIELLYKDKY